VKVRFLALIPALALMPGLALALILAGSNDTSARFERQEADVSAAPDWMLNRRALVAARGAALHVAGRAKSKQQDTVNTVPIMM